MAPLSASLLPFLLREGHAPTCRGQGRNSYELQRRRSMKLGGGLCEQEGGLCTGMRALSWPLGVLGWFLWVGLEIGRASCRERVYVLV